MPSPNAPVKVTLAVGSEDFLVERAVSRAVHAAREATPDSDVATVEAGELTAGSWEELVSPSLFAANRIVVVTGIEKAAVDVAGRLSGFMASPEPDVVLVLTHLGPTRGNKALLESLRKGGAHVVTCDKVTRATELTSFVVGEVTSAGGRIQPAAASRLVEALGTDLRGLAAAAAQLTDVGEGRIDTALVDTFFEGRAEVRGWVVAEAVMDGNTDKALGELRWALASGTEGPMIVGSLASALRTMAAALDLAPATREGDAARILGVPPFKVKIVRNQARGWTRGGVANAVVAVSRADVAIKGGIDDGRKIKGATNDTSLALMRTVVDMIEGKAKR